MPLPHDAPTIATRPTSDPIWLQKIVDYLRRNAAQFDQHDKMQLVFDRSGDHVVSDVTYKSIKLTL